MDHIFKVFVKFKNNYIKKKCIFNFSRFLRQLESWKEKILIINLEYINGIDQKSSLINLLLNKDY